jgi:hypothetical protein
MKKILRAALLLGFVGCLASTRAQESAVNASDDIARLKGEIRQGNFEAIVQAGNSHDSVFVSDLKNLEGSKIAKQKNLSRAIRISLAKLGDDAALQETYCRVQSQYPLIKQNAIENDLTNIGGWFSIWVLERQFEEDDRWRKAPRKYWKSVAPDVMLVRPSNLALMVLPKLVKDPPLPSLIPVMAQTSSSQQAKIDTWKTWIDANGTTLRTLKPAGQDVNTSPAGCAPYRTKEKEWLAAIMH